MRKTEEKNNRHLLMKPNLVSPSHSSRVQPTELLRQRLGEEGRREGGATSLSKSETLKQRSRDEVVQLNQRF